MKHIFSLIIVIAGITLLQACYYDKEQLLLPPQSGVTPTNCASYSFTKEVSPIVQASCSNNSGCHGSGSSNGPGELITYTEIKNADAQIQGSILAGRMPLGSKLSIAQTQTITCWISGGALNN